MRVSGLQITFAVTSKDKKEGSQKWAAFKSALEVTWPYLVWLAGFVAGIIYFVVNAALGKVGREGTMAVEHCCTTSNAVVMQLCCNT